MSVSLKSVWFTRASSRIDSNSYKETLSRKQKKNGMVAHTFNPRNQGTEVGGSLRIGDQPRLRSETMSLKRKRKKEENLKKEKQK